jgi:hypothetical protein
MRLSERTTFLRCLGKLVQTSLAAPKLSNCVKCANLRSARLAGRRQRRGDRGGAGSAGTLLSSRSLCVSGLSMMPSRRRCAACLIVLSSRSVFWCFLCQGTWVPLSVTAVWQGFHGRSGPEGMQTAPHNSMSHRREAGAARYADPTPLNAHLQHAMPNGFPKMVRMLASRVVHSLRTRPSQATHQSLEIGIACPWRKRASIPADVRTPSEGNPCQQHLAAAASR